MATADQLAAVILAARVKISQEKTHAPFKWGDDDIKRCTGPKNGNKSEGGEEATNKKLRRRR